MEPEDEFSVWIGRRRPAPTRVARITPGRLARRGRGQAAVRSARATVGTRREFRRVIVKARITRLKPGSAAVRAHLKYLQRDAGGPDGAPGRLYDAVSDQADGRAFLARGDGDRHQFRFIVAPEEGGELDLTAYIRQLMRRMEQDLGTVLDWVAVDHADTAHPHSHIVVRGVTDLGKDLLISQDYITEGLRLRARELATEILGERTPEVMRAALEREVNAERFTRLDRSILWHAREGVIDLRGGARDKLNADILRDDLLPRRLERLEQLELAKSIGRQVWRLDPELEAELRVRGERGDILKAMNRALARRGEARHPEDLALETDLAVPVHGRLIDKGLAGPTEERASLIVDCVDGKVRRVSISLQGAAELPLGAILQIGEGATAADHNIAEVAASSGVYSPDEHLRRLEAKELPLPEGAEPMDVVRSHVRRLEALRRARIAERRSDGRWHISRDFLDQASAYERRRRGMARLVSALDLEAQVASRGATWLDRQLVAREPVELADRGFGLEVKAALGRRSQVLVQRWLAMETDEGVVYRQGLINALTQNETRQAGEAYARPHHWKYRPVEPGEAISGRYIGKLQLDSGTFAVVESRDRLAISLIPWRPAIEQHLGREVTARIERGMGVSWELGRGRDRGLSR